MSPDERNEGHRRAAEVTDVSGAGGADGGAAGGADGGAETAPVGTGAIFGADVDPALLTALTSLAARTRELVGAVVLTDAAVAELDAVAGEIELLTARLGARRRAGPLRLNIDPKNGRLRQPHSPVTGDANPLAPPITITTTPAGTARAEFVLGPAYEGPPGAVHGGVCAAILDHLLGSAAAAGAKPGMTATLSLRYLRPTPIGASLAAEAWISGGAGRVTTADGRIRNERGVPTVEAKGEFVMPRRWRPLAPRAAGPDGGQPG
ncbi:MAG TPA: PaaI family thioesterase [Streptosporangiaceae bacterium]|nr:PaaI family thioesterase [Streptosporangiaceae bacterium]